MINSSGNKNLQLTTRIYKHNNPATTTKSQCGFTHVDRTWQSFLLIFFLMSDNFHRLFLLVLQTYMNYTQPLDSLVDFSFESV